MKKLPLLLVWMIILLPRFVHAQITISEVAWMGTSSSQYEEWIELHNDGAEDISLGGWVFKKNGGTTLINLSGTIASDSYYIICRTTASITNPLGGACDEQGQFGGSGLNNASEQLDLIDATGNQIDSINATAGWPAGDSSTKNTMQKASSGWITAPPTPQEATDSDNGTANTNDQENVPVATTNSVASTKDPKEKVEIVEPDPVFKARMLIPDYGITGVDFPLRAEVLRDDVAVTKRGRFEWSTGDGGYYELFRNEDIVHVFQYPGEYTIILAYYSDVFRDEPDTIHRKKISIISDAIDIARTTPDGGAVIGNHSDKEINLAGWSIENKGKVFTIPKYTFIPGNGEVSFSGKTIGFLVQSGAMIKNPHGEVVTMYSEKRPRVAGVVEDLSETTQESVTQNPDWSSQSRAKQEQNHFQVFMDKYLWIFTLLGIVFVASVAYFVVRLYASQNETESSELGDLL